MTTPRLVTERLESQGIVLSAIPFSEADLMLHVMLRDYGKVSMLAKHARSNSKRFSGRVDIFEQGNFTADLGYGEVYRLRSVNSKRAFAQLRDDLDKYCIANLTVEAFAMLVKEGCGESIQLYELLALALKAYCEAKDTRELLRSSFITIRQLLCQSGFAVAEQFTMPSLKHFEYLIEQIEIHTERKLRSREALEMVFSNLRNEPS